MTTAIVILFIISALMGTALATLFYEVDFRANQLQNVNSKQIKTRDQILQMISNIDSQVKSLAGKVNEIESNLYMINEATDTADELNKEASDIIVKLQEYSRQRTDEEVANYEKLQEYNKRAASQSIEEIVEERELTREEVYEQKIAHEEDELKDSTVQTTQDDNQ